MERIRALIVDDEPLARDRIRDLLDRDPEVAVMADCRDGQEAIAAIREHAPDLVFLDVQMPEKSGFDVITEVGVERLPVIVFVTAHRRESFGQPFRELCLAIRDLAERFAAEGVQFVYPVHLNPNVQAPVRELLADLPNVHLLDPLDYHSLVQMLKRAAMVVGEQFQPDFGLAHGRRFVQPQSVRTEFEADRRLLVGERLQADDIPVEGDRRLVLMRRDFHGDVDAALQGGGHGPAPSDIVIARGLAAHFAAHHGHRHFLFP